MNILMLTPYLPFPLLSGGQIRTYNLLKYLSRKHNITLFSFIRSEKEKRYISSLREFCDYIKVYPKKPPWSPSSLLKSATSVYPLVVCMYLNRQLRNEIGLLLQKKHFDLIHAETFYVMPNLPTHRIPTILVEQTIEYLVYQHYTENVSLLPLKWLMNFDVFKIKMWEKNFWQKATRVVAMSESDKNIMAQMVPNLHIDLVPNGVDTKFFSFKKLNKMHGSILLFVGNFKWLQNREAVEILVKQIWPRIVKRIPQAKLWIVGRFPSREIMKFAAKNIIVSYDIDDIRSVYHHADLLIAPIYGPGGTRYKILEAMAAGLPVVTTPTGIEGLGAQNNKDAAVAQTPEQLAQVAVKVLKNIKLYKELSVNGRKLIEKNFDWKAIAIALDRIYREASYEKEN